MNALKRIPRRRLIATGAGLIVLALLAAWLLWPESGPDDHRTNPDALSMAITQAELDEIAELHTHVDGEAVTDVLGTAHGALLVLDHGVVALSGAQWPDHRDGQWPEQWRYLDDESITDVEVLPTDNANEPISLTKGHAGDVDHSVTLLDSHTGSIEGSAQVGETFNAGDGVHLTSDAMLQQSGDILRSYSLGDDDVPLGERAWTLDTEELCSAPNTVTESADITSSSRGFIISLGCTEPGQGNHSQVILHQDSGANSDQSGLDANQRWRMVWDDVDPGAQPTKVHFTSAAVVPDSPDDIVSNVIRNDNPYSYAFALPQRNDGPNYHTPALYQDWDAQGYFSEPLLDSDIYPEVLIVGRNADLDPHISMQSAKILLNDPDVDFSREDYSILQWDSDGAMAEPQSYRAYETPDFTLDLDPEIEQALP